METLPNFEVVRAVASTVRAKDSADGGMPTMEVRFSVFNKWYEINSWIEGNFLERTVPGAFSKTISESKDQIKSLFNHGFDPSIGEKVLGPVAELREDPDSPVGLVPLFDTSYNRDLLPGLKSDPPVYGSSMRMRVVKEEWNDSPGVSEHNPKGIPERTIKEVRLFEFGPVTFPANPESTASVRSMTDEYYAAMRARDPEKVEALMRSRESMIALHRAEQPATATAEPVAAAEPATVEPANDHSKGLSAGERRRQLNHLPERKTA